MVFERMPIEERNMIWRSSRLLLFSFAGVWLVRVGDLGQQGPRSKFCSFVFDFPLPLMID